MKFPQFKDYKTVLKYPKEEGITKAEVMKQKRGFSFPKAWEFKEDPKEYKLILHPKRVRKYYYKKVK